MKVPVYHFLDNQGKIKTDTLMIVSGSFAVTAYDRYAASELLQARIEIERLKSELERVSKNLNSEIDALKTQINGSTE